MYLFLSDSGHVLAASEVQKFGYVYIDSTITSALPYPVTQYRYTDGMFVHSVRPSLLHVWINGAWAFHGNLTYLASSRQVISTAIKDLRDVRKNKGVKIGNDWFHSDEPSRVQHLGLLRMGDAIPADLLWKTMQGTFVVMTKPLTESIFNATLFHDMNTFAIAELHIACMTEYSNPYEYDYSGKWPAIYGE